MERINTEIVDCVFQCFFRLLKASPLNLRVLPVVLRGISKYAHLISIDFMSDIIAVVRQLATAATTPPQLQIMCVSCVTTVLRNQVRYEVLVLESRLTLHRAAPGASTSKTSPLLSTVRFFTLLYDPRPPMQPPTICTTPKKTGTNSPGC